jgi:hypothetical protein
VLAVSRTDGEAGRRAGGYIRADKGIAVAMSEKIDGLSMDIAAAEQDKLRAVFPSNGTTALSPERTRRSSSPNG